LLYPCLITFYITESTIKGRFPGGSYFLFVTGPAVRMTEEKMKKYTPLLFKAASDISKKLGYSS